jgi:hypothetical protein
VQRAPEGTIAIVTKDGRPVAPEEWLANGRVLAAAPDLLAALDEIARNGGATILGPLADTEGFHALGAATAFEWCAQIARGHAGYRQGHGSHAMTAHPPALVERVARAICDELHPSIWESLNDREKSPYRNMAIAALDASGHAEMVAALERPGDRRR